MERHIRDLQGVVETVGRAARISRDTNDQSIPHNTTTTLTYETVEFDAGGYADLSANNDRLTVSEPGIYLVGYTTVLNLAVTSSGRMLTQVDHYDSGNNLVRGELARVEQYLSSTVSSSDPAHTGTDIIVASPGDYIVAVMYQNTGVSKLVHSGADPHLWIARLA